MSALRGRTQAGLLAVGQGLGGDLVEMGGRLVPFLGSIPRGLGGPACVGFQLVGALLLVGTVGVGAERGRADLEVLGFPLGGVRPGLWPGRCLVRGARRWCVWRLCRVVFGCQEEWCPPCPWMCRHSDSVSGSSCVAGQAGAVMIW